VPIAIGSRERLRAEETVERAAFVAPEGAFSAHDNAGAVAAASTVILLERMLEVAQQAAEMVPDGVRVVSALHTISAASLSDLEHPLEQDVLMCGDVAADKLEAAGLIELIGGLRCVDCGRLEMARIAESLTAMLISVNARYKAHAGIRLTSLPERLWE